MDKNTNCYFTFLDRNGRAKVSSFLRQGDSAILLNGFTPNGITARTAVENFFEYVPEHGYYTPSIFSNTKEYLESGVNTNKEPV